MQIVRHKPRERCQVVEPAWKIPSLLEDVRSGLQNPPRSLPPKYFYDDRGSKLFDRICDTTEYYPTRTEDALLNRYALDIISEASADRIIEFGSGRSSKTRRLLDACQALEIHCDYLPFDVCEPMLENSAAELQLEYEWLSVRPLLGDYIAGLAYLPQSEGKDLYVFLGSTIGNFDARSANTFIADLRKVMSTGDYFLLGADRVKDSAILDAAYNDREGITAEFNLNVLRVLNRELGSDFELENFRHLAYYNNAQQQIEMYLQSQLPQSVRIESANLCVNLEQNEKILTEISRKFELKDIENLLGNNSLKIVNCFQPANNYFGLWLARAV